MGFGLSRFVAVCALVALTGVIGCGGNGAEQVADNSAERAATLNELEAAQQALAEKRQQLRQIDSQIEDPSTVEVAEGETAPTTEELQAQAKALKNEIESESDEFGRRIVEFINEDPPIEGEPLNEQQRKAIDLKIQEDILVAKEWIDTGGDYRRAINILESLVPLDPTNATLTAELGTAREMRFMTEERFAQVKKGFTEREVRDVLGPVNLRNKKDYPDKKASAWFYPKEDGGAAAVYFQQKGGKNVVYQTNFKAIEPDTGGVESED